MNFLKQIINSIKLHGLSFTLKLVKFKFLGGEDPRNAPEFINRMHEHLEPAHFLEQLRPYYADADSLSEEEVRQLRRALLPIDSMVDSPLTTQRINVVLDHADEAALEENRELLTIAAAYAKKHDCILRIISRCAVPNPAVFFKKTKTMGISLPEHTDFYSDINRSNYGFCSFKLPVTAEDIFITAKWYTAIALKDTSIHPAVFYYAAPNNLFASREQNDRCFGQLSSSTCGLIPTNRLWTTLNEIYPHFTQQSLCTEGISAEKICEFMENRI